MQKYIVVEARRSEVLMEMVNKKLDEGYVPTGGVTIDQDGWLFQSMIFKEVPASTLCEFSEKPPQSSPEIDELKTFTEFKEHVKLDHPVEKIPLDDD